MAEKVDLEKWFDALEEGEEGIAPFNLWAGSSFRTDPALVRSALERALGIAIRRGYNTARGICLVWLGWIANDEARYDDAVAAQAEGFGFLGEAGGAAALSSPDARTRPDEYLFSRSPEEARAELDLVLEANGKVARSILAKRFQAMLDADTVRFDAAAALVLAQDAPPGPPPSAARMTDILEAEAAVRLGLRPYAVAYAAFDLEEKAAAGDPFLLASIQGTRGRCLKEEGRTAEAIEALASAAEIARTSGNGLQEWEARREIAFLHRSAGDFRAAVDQLEDASRLDRGITTDRSSGAAAAGQMSRAVSDLYTVHSAIGRSVALSADLPSAAAVCLRAAFRAAPADLVAFAVEGPGGELAFFCSGADGEARRFSASAAGAGADALPAALTGNRPGDYASYVCAAFRGASRPTCAAAAFGRLPRVFGRRHVGELRRLAAFLSVAAAMEGLRASAAARGKRAQEVPR